jgi:hypothetical protein
MFEWMGDLDKCYEIRQRERERHVNKDGEQPTQEYHGVFLRYYKSTLTQQLSEGISVC